MTEENSVWRFFRVRKSLFFKFSLLALSLYPQAFDKLIAEEEIGLIDLEPIEEENKKDTYKINFNNVAITEYIRFVSKISGLNFVFDEGELQFNVTIVSEEPISTRNIMAALIQVLRIHGLTILEQENNLLITRNTTVSQVPTIVSAEVPDGDAKKAPIVTRIFRIKNANPDNLAALIRPMASATALIEVSKETRQLIVTDIVTNVNKIGSLLLSLDSPHSPLDIETYVAKNISPAELIALANQILTPFAEGNPLLFVPQLETNTIFIVSTPYLIERAMAVIEDLDIKSKTPPLSIKKTGNVSFFIYRIVNANEEQMDHAVKQMIENLDKAPARDEDLIEAMKSMRWIKETNSLVFTGDEKSLDQIKQLLPDLDVNPSLSKRALTTGSNFLMYKPKFRSGSEIETSLREVGKKLKDSGLADPMLLNAIEKMKWVPLTNSLIFTGDPVTLQRISTMVSEIDNEGGTAAEGYFLYKLLHAHGDVVLKDLKKFADQLPKDDLSQVVLIKTIHDIKWIKETNSLLITGPVSSIEKTKDLIAQFDGAGTSSKSSFYIYKPQHQPAEFIQSSLENISIDFEKSGLMDADLLQTLKTMRYVPSTNSILFTGTPDSLQKVQEILQTIDVTTPEALIQRVGNLTFLIYKLEYVSAPQFMSSLRSVAQELDKSNVLDKELAHTISSMKWIKETHSILFTGTAQSLQRIDALAKKFDIPSLAGGKAVALPLNYILYTPKYVNGPDLISILCDFERNLTDSGLSDTPLFEAINNLKWMEQTSSLVITGDADTIKKIEGLLEKFDIPSAAKEGSPPSIESIENTSFLVFKLQYHQGGDIITAVKQVASEISKGTASSQNLVNSINSLQWITVTNSLIATGEQDVLTKLKDLISNLDVPLKQVFIEVLIIETSLANTQNFGLQWAGFAKYRNKVGIGFGNFPATNPFTGVTPNTPGIQPAMQQITATRFPTPNTDIPFSQGFDLGAIGDIIMHKGRSFISLGSLVNALQSDADSTIVLNPKIITQDTTNSTVFVGQNVPYVGSTLTVSGGTNQSLNSNIEYRDIGMNLSITPYLGNGDIITLEIANDISSQVNTPSGSASVPQGILTNHASLNTRVHVPDKHFVAISGMIQDTKTHFKSGIPCLGGLPVIGAAFSENDRTNSKTNLIIFVRPQIIHSFQEYKEITDHQENLYKENAVLPLLKEEFDDGLNLVKQPDNE